MLSTLKEKGVLYYPSCCWSRDSFLPRSYLKPMQTIRNGTRDRAGRVPLTGLQSSEPVIRSDYGKKTWLAPSKDGQSLYSLDATRDLIVYEKNGKPAKKVSASFLNVSLPGQDL